MLKQRVIAALILVPLFLAAIFLLPNQWFALALIVPLLLGAYEWANIMGVEQPKSRLNYVLIYGVILAVFYWLSWYFIVPLAMLWWLVALYFVKSYPQQSAKWSGQGALFFIGFLLLVPSVMSLILLQGQAQGSYWVMYLMFLVWGADTGAYFAGRAFGKAKLAPNVSPGKSIAGLVGGLLVTFAIALGVMFTTPASQQVGSIAFLFISMLTVLASVLGDLAESMFKRHRGIKDSGTLIPGHGGILDRIDSVTAAGPVFVGAMYLLGGFR